MYDIVAFDFESSEVRILWKDAEPWFVLVDICKALDISNPSRMAQRLDEDERSVYNLGRQGEAIIINESGLYTVILRSNKPEARIFKHWITHEVLPSLRKTGSYSLSKAPEAELLREIQRLNEINERTNQKLDILIKQNEQKKIKKQLPKEPLPDDEKAMIISAICDLAQKNQKVKVSYLTFRNILVSKFGKDVLPKHPTRYLIALAPELEEKKIRLEKVGKGLREQSKSMVQGGFIICS
jgi:prophage antirepressor-like protein